MTSHAYTGNTILRLVGSFTGQDLISKKTELIPSFSGLSQRCTRLDEMVDMLIGETVVFCIDS